jgi:hypothetical protein
MNSKHIELAINKLGIEFTNLDLSFHKIENSKTEDVTFY